MIDRSERIEKAAVALDKAAEWFDNAGATAVHGGPDHDEGCAPCEAILALRAARRAFCRALTLPASGDAREATDAEGAERWCAAFGTWVKALVDAGDEPLGRAFAQIEGRLWKSSLARRLFYEGEKLRTEKCPVHNGRWSGMFSDRPKGCLCMRFDGDEATGWIPGPESDPANSRNPVMLGTIVKGGFVPANPGIERMEMRPVEPPTKDAAPRGEVSP